MCFTYEIKQRFPKQLIKKRKNLDIHRRLKREREKPNKRSSADQGVINQAKSLLMEKNELTEEEAHRYLQKRSMDNGTNMVETAYMVLQVF